MTSPSTRRIVAAGTIGNLLEWYDFAIYGYFAATIGRVFFPAENPVAQVLAALDEIDVPCAKVQRIDEVLADPQIQARGMVIEQDHPALGKIRLPNLPFHFSGCDTTVTQVAPDLGQHNAEVAASVGFSAEQIAAMQADGVLYSV